MTIILKWDVLFCIDNVTFTILITLSVHEFSGNKTSTNVMKSTG